MYNIVRILLIEFWLSTYREITRHCNCNSSLLYLFQNKTSPFRIGSVKVLLYLFIWFVSNLTGKISWTNHQLHYTYIYSSVVEGKKWRNSSFQVGRLQYFGFILILQQARLDIILYDILIYINKYIYKYVLCIIMWMSSLFFLFLTVTYKAKLSLTCKVYSIQHLNSTKYQNTKML